VGVFGQNSLTQAPSHQSEYRRRELSPTTLETVVTKLMGRRETLERIGDDTLDVLIIGGGIVGAGIARDSAMRGLSVALVEQHDFASGTSSRSSRLLHGGLRYLAQGRIGLVRDSSHEKMILHRIAPHLARPMPFVFPTYRGTSWKRWKLSIGVKIYDLLCGKTNLGSSSSLSVDKTLALLPGLRKDNLSGAVRYFDGVTQDARLVLDSLRSAAAHDATVVNQVAFKSAERTNDLWHCQLEDGESGASIPAKARVIINAAGAWASRLPRSKVKLRLTKGVHLVIDHARLPVPETVVMTEGPRILFAIPWGRRVILGTTDTDYDGELDHPRCEPQDVQYILDVVNGSFPTATLRPDDVISTYAGLRPLIADPNGKPSDISRAHEIIAGDDGWIDVAGGKLTAYRLMAQQTVDRVVRQLKREAQPCRTAQEPLLQGEDTPRFSGVEPPEVTREAVAHYCSNEWALHLEDVMLRRAGWHLYHRDAAQIAGQVAQWMAAQWSWSAPQLQNELDRYHRSANC
jgi:glycerol-3-phosphate dehydrogenase